MRSTCLFTLLSACGGGGPVSLNTTTGTVTTNQNGVVDIDFVLSDDADNFLLTVEADQGLVAVEYLTDHRGVDVLSWEDWYDDTDSLTSAIFGEAAATQLNWPVRDGDRRLRAGDWTASMGVYDDDYDALSDVDLSWTLQVKQDPSYADGEVAITLAYVDGLEDDPEISAAVEAAVARWEQIWGDVGLSLSVSWTVADLPADLSFEDPDGLRAVAAEGDERDILVVIGESIEGDAWTYGYAGDIPGTLVSTDYAAVYLSWLANSGGDGSFDDADIRLFGETMAHEVGHYAGLFHPVEDGWDYWDALRDTARCTSTSACESKLGDNLMFPYPVCDGSSCEPQDWITNDQCGVMQRYVGVL